jgi:hypothetical protein
MKHLPLLLAFVLLLLSCGNSPYGKLQNARDYSGLCGDITEGLTRVVATVSSSNSSATEVKLRTLRGRMIDVHWPAEFPAIATLDANKQYSFDLILTHWKKLNLDTASVYRISDEEKVLADLSLCSLHRKPMFREEEDWINAEELIRKDQDRLYPNSGIFHALCGSGMHHVVWVCPTCLDAERQATQRLNRR